MYKNPIRTVIIYIFIILIVVTILGFISLKVLIPHDPVKQGFDVTIKGAVETNVSEDALPLYVWVYKEYTYTDRIYAEGTLVDLQMIRWDTKNKGTYSLTFHLPIAQRLVITTLAYGCNNRVVDVSPDNAVVELNLTHDQRTCSSRSYAVPDVPSILEKQVRNGLTRDFADSTNNNYNSNQTQRIQSDVDEAENELEDYDATDLTNQSLVHLYRAAWLDWRATYRVSIYETQACLEKAMPYLTENSSCEIYPYEAVEGLTDINDSFSEFDESNWLFRDGYREHNISELEDGIYTLRSNRERQMEFQRECEKYAQIIEASHDYQEPICEARNAAKTTTNWSSALALICLGFLLYAPLRGWIEK